VFWRCGLRYLVSIFRADFTMNREAEYSIETLLYAYGTNGFITYRKKT